MKTSIVLSMIGIVCCVWTSDGQVPDHSAEERQNILQRLAKADQGRFILQGVIVNEGGQPLSGATITVTKTKSGGPFQEVRTEEERHVVNGKFAYDYRGCLSIKMTFACEGYYRSIVLFRNDEPPVNDEQILGQKPMLPPLVERTDLRIVLEKRGNTVQLLRYNEVLEYHKSGRGVVIDMDQSTVRRESLRTVSNIHDLGQMPTNAVYMVAERDAQGQISVVRRKRPNSSVTDVVPHRLTLVMTAPDGGFVRFNSQPGRRVSSQTKVAPDTGYQRELTILSEDFVAGGTRGGVMFFFRTQGRFGKGGTGWVEVDADLSRVQLSVLFQVQTDGSRNLETEPEPHELLAMESLRPGGDDNTSPIIAILGANPVIITCDSVYTDAGATASDNKDGDLTASITTTSTVNPDVAGTYTTTHSVKDATGNEATASRTVKVLYNFTGFLLPINGADGTGGTVQDPIKTFKAGSQIPVKFTIACGDNAVNSGAHTLQVVKWNNETTAAEPVDASPADAATQGNQFRWVDDHWQYILDTQATNMDVGAWELRATLSDGSKHSVFIGLK